ncbi:MAG: HIT domain-containing protein [Patescibacteria group bacterium]|nr:HIT domain-containing protein [Patescibacteria group bacterium]
MRIYEESRGKYRTTRKSAGCDFCDKEVIRDQQVKQLEGEYWRVFACKYPYMDGNLMIMPKRHIKDVDKFTSAEWEEFGEVLIKTKHLLGHLFKTKSFNVMLQIGPNSGGSIRHLHWMIIPRPKKKNLSGWNIYNNFYFVTLSYKELLKKIDNHYKTKKS